jgi:hypothetical protein
MYQFVTKYRGRVRTVAPPPPLRIRSAEFISIRSCPQRKIATWRIVQANSNESAKCVFAKGYVAPHAEVADNSNREAAAIVDFALH